MRCPVCKAGNQPPSPPAAPGGGTLGVRACRRCKADLSLLFALEEQRQEAMHSARLALDEQRFGAAYDEATRADRLRSDEESKRLLAVTALFARDFHQAWRCFRAVGSVRSSLLE